METFEEVARNSGKSEPEIDMLIEELELRIRTAEER